MKIKNVQSLICLVIFLLFANQAWAANWIYYDTAPVGHMYYDKSSIKKVNKNIIKVWTKTILNENGKAKYFSMLNEKDEVPVNSDTLSYEVGFFEIDCVNEKIRSSDSTIYDEKGNVIYSSPKSQSGEWNDIFPISVGEKLKNKICEELVTPKEAVVAASPHYYEGIKGIVLKNGKVIEGQIISIDDNDVLKIRTKEGKILSYSFMKEVKEYITE